MIRNLIKNTYTLKQSNKLSSVLRSFSTTQVARPVQQLNELQTAENERNASDLRKLAEEQTAQLRQNTSLYFAPWVNDFKPVFEAEIPQYSGLCHGLIAGVLGGAFLYMLWQGDTKYKYLVATPLLALYFARKGAINQMKSSVPYLHQMNLHRDGKAVNLVISQHGELSTLNNVPVSQLKLHRGDVKQTVEVPAELEGETGLSAGQTVQLSYAKARLLGVSSNAYLLQTSEGFIAAPYNYNGNEYALGNIWEGQNVDTTQI